MQRSNASLGAVRDVDPKWAREAAALLRAPRLHVPVDVLLEEAVDVARFARRCWKNATDATGKVIGPGLMSIFGERNIADEVLELVEAVHAAQASFRLNGEPERGPLDRARFVRRELRAALRFLSAGARRSQLSQQLAALAREHDRAVSYDALAAALYDYAGLASRNASKLATLPVVELSLIDEASSLAGALRERPTRSVAMEPRKRARALRDRLATLLSERIALLRRTSRYLFRHHPALVRESTSAYERGRRKRGRGRGKHGRRR